MSDKIKKIYHALIDGAEAGLSDAALYKYVIEECPKATSKKIVKASLLALSDPDVKDANILHVVYALAIKHRLDPATTHDIEDPVEVAAPVVEAPQIKKVRAPRKPPVNQPSI